MDQAIAVEWGRFLRELEAQNKDGLKNNSSNHNGGGAEDGAKSGLDGAKNPVLQRLEDALALPPAPEEPLCLEARVPSVEQTDGMQPQEPADEDRSVLDRFARNLAGNGTRTTWMKTSPADPSSVLEPKRVMTGEIGMFSTRTQWNGTGFEERRVPVTPPAENVSATEPQLATIHEDAAEQKVSFTSTENREEEMWKTVSRPDAAVSEEPATSADAMQAAHGQETSRWFVLKGVLGGATAPEKTPDLGPAAEIPLVEVFSLAGGVGKTSLVATLGRALSARGERVLLVEATPLASLQYFFGACDSRPGVVRTFRPPAVSSDAPIRLASFDPEALVVESAVQGSMATDIQKWAQGVSRVIVDVATGSTSTVRGLSRMSPVVLVPLIPDVQAIVTAKSIDAFFQRNGAATGTNSEVYYLLNQFDPSLPLHLDVRKVLRERLGERMLPFTLPRTPAVSEALAEGMTIVDYAPDSPATEEFASLAKWLEDALAPADMNLRGMRWSER